MSSHNNNKTPFHFVKEICSVSILKKSLNLFDLIRPMYVISRIFGMLPFKLLHSSMDGIVGQCVRPADLFWFIISIGFHFCLAFLSNQNFKADEHWQTKSLFSVIANLSLFFDITLSMLIIIFDMVHRQHIIKILRQFIEFDKKVRFISCLLAPSPFQFNLLKK